MTGTAESQGIPREKKQTHAGQESQSQIAPAQQPEPSTAIEPDDRREQQGVRYDHPSGPARKGAEKAHPPRRGPRLERTLAQAGQHFDQLVEQNQDNRHEEQLDQWPDSRIGKHYRTGSFRERRANLAFPGVPLGRVSMKLVAFRTVAVFGLGAVVSCGGGPAEPSEPTTLEFIAGQGQQGQAGVALGTKIVVKASNSKGAVAGVTITMAAENPGGGSVSPHSATTAQDGTAQFTWSLGSKIGTQILTATFSGTTSVTATLTAVATTGPASAVIGTTDQFQFVVVGRAVPVLPTVQVTDALGNPIAGIPVTFEAVSTGSILAGTSQSSNPQGMATLGGWTIGNDAQSYTVRASIPGGASTQFEARGIPAALTVLEGTDQSVNAGTAVPVVPAVKATRDDGTPLASVPVDFTVLSGGGSVTGGAAFTGTDGIARPTRWVLGVNPGSNRLQAITSGRPAVSFDATGVLATPAQIIAGGGALSGFFGNYLSSNPQVTVLDDQGKPVAGAAVTFQVTDGGGRLTQPAGTTDFQGRAATTSWRLGPSGAQTVTATAGALAPVSFTAQGNDPPASTFKLEVRYAPGTTPNAAQQAAFDAAVARWKTLVLSGAPPYQVVASDLDPTGDCPSMLNETVDGTVLYVRIQSLGNANILGATGLCVIRDQGFLPVQAIMYLNTAAAVNLEANGLLAPVILHEMAHALGFGTLWDITVPGLGSIQLIQGGGSCSSPASNPTFSGPIRHQRVLWFGRHRFGLHRHPGAHREEATEKSRRREPFGHETGADEAERHASG